MMTDTNLPGSALAASPGALGPEAWNQLFRDARSNVLFVDRPVDPALIRDVFEHAALGPTGNNAGPARLAVIESQEARARVMTHASPANVMKLELAPLILVVARDDRYHDHLHVTSPGSDHIRERLEIAVEERAQKAHDGTWLTAGYLILALRAAGLAVRPYGGFDKVGVTEDLLAGTSWAAEMLLGVGYPPEGDHGAGERRGRVAWEDAARIF